ncbi:MAG: Wzz/FepE/Etk N-terminal domain-containing protein, partial [Thermus sp.]|nr:Wzz/FepE/Etk N-terminal domain-containing protein [Thermus sp.]
MVETPADELSLRDILETLKRQRLWILSLPVVFGVTALIYGFFIAEPRYASTATLNVAPVQVQAQLEQRIQVQGQSVLTFEGLKALAFSEEVTREVWEALRKEGKLPTAWQDQGGSPGLQRMVKAFRIKNESPRQQAVPQGQVPPVVASLTVEAPSPEVAARAANLWAEAVVRQVTRLPLSGLQDSLETLEKVAAKAEKTYREAQARFEAFQRTSTLGQDRAELEALTGEKTQTAQVQVAVEPRIGERILLAQQLAEVERDLASVRATIRFLEQKLVQVRDNPSDSQSNGARLRLQNLLLDAQMEEARLLARKAALEARIAQVEARINLLKERMARVQVEEERVRQALELSRNAYVALVQKRTDLQIELASSQNSMAQVIAPAYPIYEKVAPKRALILALAVFLGLVLGVMAAFVAEALRPP